MASGKLSSHLVHCVHHVLLNGRVLRVFEVGHVGREPFLNNLNWWLFFASDDFSAFFGVLKQNGSLLVDVFTRLAQLRP